MPFMGNPKANEFTNHYSLLMQHNLIFMHLNFSKLLTWKLIRILFLISGWKLLAKIVPSINKINQLCSEMLKFLNLRYIGIYLNRNTYIHDTHKHTPNISKILSMGRWIMNWMRKCNGKKFNSSLFLFGGIKWFFRFLIILWNQWTGSIEIILLLIFSVTQIHDKPIGTPI